MQSHFRNITKKTKIIHHLADSFSGGQHQTKKELRSKMSGFFMGKIFGTNFRIIVFEKIPPFLTLISF
ncbi:hypothetical protein KBC86_00780 [Candidatus Gracilibacteria bacterium]|nr:hypothetical protein [Candidatus Gracilibacteria bacterium]